MHIDWSSLFQQGQHSYRLFVKNAAQSHGGNPKPVRCKVRVALRHDTGSTMNY
jgi:hypothetical protein